MKIHDVFVIFPCPKSQKFAHELVQDLKEERISVFGDFQRMKGQSDSYILDLLRASSNVIIVLPLNIENYLKNGDFFRKEISCILEMDKNVLLLNSENFKWPDVLPNDISKIKFATELYLTNDYTDDIPGCYIYEILSCLTNVPALESKPFTWKEKFRIASVVISLICWILPFLITCFFFQFFINVIDVNMYVSDGDICERFVFIDYNLFERI